MIFFSFFFVKITQQKKEKEEETGMIEETNKNGSFSFECFGRYHHHHHNHHQRLRFVAIFFTIKL